jgi:DNA transposition AAA+ family ATPase
MKIAYTDPKNLRTETRQLLGQITNVVEEYGSQGFKLTLRQLYYQLVAADIIPNKQPMYAKLSTILKDALV